MRWVTFEMDGVNRPGIVDDQGRVVDLRKALEVAGSSGRAPDTLQEVCGAPDVERQLVRRAIEQAPPEARFPRSVARLRAPIERPGKLICLAGNYREHVLESGFEVVNSDDPITPHMFLKPATCLAADGETIPLGPHNVKVGWEVELAVVIGRGGRHIPEVQALDCVFGYTILNDLSERSLHALSARRVRERDPFFDWLAGKWFDGFAPCGPWIVERQDLADPHALELRLSVNGEMRQLGRTSEMMIRIPQLIAAASSIMSLEPGDLIATGTPAGAGMGTGQGHLNPGDEVVCEISGIGALRNSIGIAEAVDSL